LIRSISESEINEVSIYCYKKSEKDGIIFDILYWGALRRDEITTVKTNSLIGRIGLIIPLNILC